MTWLIGIAGGLGALARAEVAHLVKQRSMPHHATTLVNVAGAALLGFLLAAEVEQDTVLIIGTGFCGGFTTFSTWMVETRSHLRVVDAVWGVVLPLVVGVGAAALTRALF